MKILVVDNEADSSALLNDVLTGDGHTTSHVETGSQALQACLLEEFDLLICDLHLADLEGTEIVRAVKAQSPRLPVLTMGGLDGDHWEQACLDAGATHYLPKPLDLDGLRHEVALVQKARLNLTIAVVDTDGIHRIRLSKVLSALGCEVHVFGHANDAHGAMEEGTTIGLLVVDVAADDVATLVARAKGNEIPVFAMGEIIDDGVEDRLMRAGAAFFLKKPVDIDALLTQAAFLGNTR